MWVVDKEFTITRVNETLLSLLKRKSDDVIGKQCYDVFAGSACLTADCPMERLKKGAKRIECDTVKKDEQGAERPFILTASPFRDFGDEFMGIVEAFKDITERKRIEQALHQANNELERLVTIDGLTQISNRRFFNERIREEWSRLSREGRPLSIIMCDVDCFKLYNDHCGHLLGDDCLRSVAAAIKKNATRPADMVARYGGEEFVVVLPNTPRHGAIRVAELIRKEVEELRIPHHTSPVSGVVTLSLGVATVVPDRDSDPTGLIRAADDALYTAKDQGRNRLVAVSDKESAGESI
jgi:diguanylate cyclase (GGDEF)-like protein/PAS domain S-box-containing protein